MKENNAQEFIAKRTAVIGEIVNRASSVLPPEQAELVSAFADTGVALANYILNNAHVTTPGEQPEVGEGDVVADTILSKVVVRGSVNASDLRLLITDYYEADVRSSSAGTAPPEFRRDPFNPLDGEFKIGQVAKWLGSVEGAIAFVGMCVATGLVEVVNPLGITNDMPTEVVQILAATGGITYKPVQLAS